jgi:hypothetical protein
MATDGVHVMAKYRMKLDVEVEATSADEAITKVAVFIARNTSNVRPMMEILPQKPFDFPRTRTYDLIEKLGEAMFTEGKPMVSKINLDIVASDAFPAPSTIQ